MGTEIEKTDSKVEINNKISQQDVIELVAHKRITKVKEDNAELDKKRLAIVEKIKEVKEKLKPALEKEINKIVKPFLEILKKQVTTKVDFNGSIPSVVITIENQYPSSIELDTTKFPKISYDELVDLDTELKQLNSQIAKNDNDIYQIKNDKNIIKNAITEQLLLNSDEGKSLLDLVEKAYVSSFPKLLK